MLKKIIVLMLGLALGLSACGSSGSTNAAGAVRKIKVPMGYIANIQYAPFYVAIEKGYFKQEGIEIEFDYSFETDGVALVGAGKLPFAVASGEQVLLARAKSLPVVYTFAWYQQYPVSVISAPEMNIKTPADLRGKTIGLPGLFGATYIGLDALLFSAGLSPADVTLQPIGFNQVQAFSAGKNKIVVGYTGNEPLQLQAQGFKLTELRVADYVQLTANGIISSEKTIKEDPNLVRSMSRALAHGIKDVIANPDEAYQISTKYVDNLADMDKKVQMQILTTSIGFWKTEKIGYSNPQAWDNMNNLLVKMKLIPSPLDLTKAFTNDFVP
jgi:NitT/TauT family transport system substrate-binding protein